MKKYILVLSVFVLSLTLLGFDANFASAQIVTTPTVATGCVSITNNLRLTSRDSNTGGDATELQDFLRSEKYLNYSNSTGYFGTLTLAAVKNFQSANGLVADGIVGSITRSKIRAMTCDGTPPIPSPNSPVIGGISGPQSLGVNQTGTWEIMASSTSGGNLSYSVVWGDEAVYRAGTEMPETISIPQQSATFTHSYARAGTYTPTFTVTSSNTINCITTPCPSNGGNATVSLSVTVGGTVTSTGSLYISPSNISLKDGGNTDTRAYYQPPEPACRFSLPPCLLPTSSPYPVVATWTSSNTKVATVAYKNLCPPDSECFAPQLDYQTAVVTGVGEGTATIIATYKSDPLVGDGPTLTLTASILVTVTATQVSSTLTIITPSPLPNAKVGVSYSATISATGGTGSYAWSSSGILPTGLTVTSADCFTTPCQGPVTISGTPMKTGPFNFTINVSSDPIVGDGPTLTASKQFTLMVDKGETTPTITVLSPNGGESLGAGTVINVRWSSVNLSGAVNFELVKGLIIAKTYLGYANSGSNTIQLPENLTPGSDYKLVVSSGNVRDSSDNFFTILSPVIGGYDACRLDKLDGVNITRNAFTDRNICLVQLCDVYGPANLSRGIESKCVFQGNEIKRYVTQPSITVLSPNGGESLQRGATQTVQWNLSGTFPTDSVRRVRLLATSANGSQTIYPLYSFPLYSFGVYNTETSYNWTVDKASDGSVIPDGSNYKIQVIVGSGLFSATTVALDESNAPFTITSAIAPPCLSCIPIYGEEQAVLGAEAFNFTQLLKNGSSGPEVMELQKFLNGAGYDSGTVDGKFGSKTMTALINLQLANGLVGDGVVGPMVRAILNQSR